MIASAYPKMTPCAAVPALDLPEASHARGCLLRLPLPPDLPVRKAIVLLSICLEPFTSLLIGIVPRSQHRERTGEAL